MSRLSFNCDVIVELDDDGLYTITIVKQGDIDQVDDINAGLSNNYKIARMMVQHYSKLVVSDDTSCNLDVIKKQFEDMKKVEVNNTVTTVNLEWENKMTMLREQHWHDLRAVTDEIDTIKKDREIEEMRHKAEIDQINSTHEMVINSFKDKLDQMAEVQRSKNDAMLTEIKSEVREDYERQLAEMKIKIAVKDEAAKNRLQPTQMEHQKECAQMQRTIDELRYEVRQLQKYKEIDLLVETKMKSINDLVKSTDNNQLGERGEMLIFEYIRERMEISEGTIERVNGLANHGDMVLRMGKLVVCIEIKNHSEPVTSSHINRFRNIDVCREEYNAGVFISVKSGFVQKSNIRDFTIDVIQGKPVVFIADAINNMKSIITAIKVLEYLVDKQQMQDQDISTYVQKINQVITSIQLLKAQIAIQKKSTREMEVVVDNMEEMLTEKKKSCKYTCSRCTQGFNLKREFKAHKC